MVLFLYLDNIIIICYNIRQKTALQLRPDAVGTTLPLYTFLIVFKLWHLGGGGLAGASAGLEHVQQFRQGYYTQKSKSNTGEHFVKSVRNQERILAKNFSIPPIFPYIGGVLKFVAIKFFLKKLN